MAIFSREDVSAGVVMSGKSVIVSADAENFSF